MPLYDELIGLLEAIEEAQADAEEKRRARDRVTMAGFSKRKDMETLRSDVAAEQMFRVTGVGAERRAYAERAWSARSRRPGSC